MVANSNAPVIASVDGFATAAGCQLVAACHMAVCSHGLVVYRLRLVKLEEMVFGINFMLGKDTFCKKRGYLQLHF